MYIQAGGGVYTGNRSAQNTRLIYNKTKYFTNPYREVSAVWTNCLTLDKNYRYTNWLCQMQR